MIDGSWIWALLGSLLMVTVLSSLTISLRWLNRGILEKLGEARGEAAMRRAQRLNEDTDGLIVLVAAGRALAVLISGVSAVLWCSSAMGETALSASSIALGVGVAFLGVWLLGAVVPQAIANHAGEALVIRTSRVLLPLHTAGRPLRAVSSWVDEVVRRLSGTPQTTEREELDAELLSVVEEGEREGQLDEVEREMIEAVVEFRSTSVESVMTPRTEVVAFESTDDLEAVKAFVRDVGHSRVPVYEGNLDHIVGVLYAKDLLRWMSEEPSESRMFELGSLLRPAVFVPETKTVRELLTQLLSQKVHLAMVADEYGGTAGLVTLEDIVEEVFGEIYDEYEPEAAAGPKVELDSDRHSAAIDARAEIDAANDELESLGLELPESDEYDTVGGFVTVSLGRIPDEGERAIVGPLAVTVLEAEATRVVRVRVERAEPDADPEHHTAHGDDPGQSPNQSKNQSGSEAGAPNGP